MSKQEIIDARLTVELLQEIIDARLTKEEFGEITSFIESLIEKRGGSNGRG